MKIKYVTVSVLVLLSSLCYGQTEKKGEIFVSRYFKKIHLGASAGVSDLLHSGGMKKSEISYDNYTQRNYAERIGRTLNLRIYWQFGKFRQSETVKLDAYDM